jgi:hypothetical protein
MNAKDAEHAASRHVHKLSRMALEEMPNNITKGLVAVEKRREEDGQQKKSELREWQKWLQFEDPPTWISRRMPDLPL